MNKILRYNQFIYESIVGESDLADRPEILEFINHLRERTYDIVDEGYNVRDYEGNSLPASRMMELHDVMHYEFKNFDII